MDMMDKNRSKKKKNQNKKAKKNRKKQNKTKTRYFSFARASYIGNVIKLWHRIVTETY